MASLRKGQKLKQAPAIPRKLWESWLQWMTEQACIYALSSFMVYVGLCGTETLAFKVVGINLS